MPGNKQEVDVRLGESKEINIPLVPGKEKPEVRPQKSSLKDSQSDAAENEDDDLSTEDNQEEKKEQDDQSGVPGQEGELGEESQSPDQKPELSPVGEMNKRPDFNKGFLNSAGIKRTREQLQKRRQEQREDDLNNIQENASEKLGSNLANSLDKKQNQSDTDNNQEEKEKDNQNPDPKPQLSSVGEMNKRPERRSEKEDKDNKKKEGKENQEGSALASSWHKLRNSLAKKKKKKDSAKELVEEAVNKTSRLASYEFYRQCWLNLIDSCGLTYFGLLFLFIGKYVLFSPKFVKFVSITDESVRIKVIQNKEITDIGMMIIFISVTGLIALSIFITIILVSLIIKAMNLTWWGLLINPEQFFSDLNDIYEFVKALL